jgi:hypothetical protein
MPQAVPVSPDDPFDGLLLPVEAWKFIDEAQIASLEELKALAPLIERLPGAGSEIADVINDRLKRLTARRTVRVRLVFSKRPYGARMQRNSEESPLAQ